MILLLNSQIDCSPLDFEIALKFVIGESGLEGCKNQGSKKKTIVGLFPCKQSVGEWLVSGFILQLTQILIFLKVVDFM